MAEYPEKYLALLPECMILPLMALSQLPAKYIA